MISAPDTERGLYPKYLLFKAGGATDPHAKAAIAAYADSCEADYPQLASELRAVAGLRFIDGAWRTTTIT